MFEPFTDEDGVPYSAARVAFNNVPIGWAEMMIEARGYRKMTMKVFVTPELWFEYRNGRFYLRESPIKPAEVAPAPVFKEVEPAGARVEPVLQHVPGMLWKRADGYFKIDDPVNNPSDRYVPTKIKGYRFEQNGPGFSVDEQWLNEEEHKQRGDPLIACGPNNENTHDPQTRPAFCASAFPQHESEPIGEIELALVTPAEAFVDITEMDEVLKPEEGDGDVLCKD